MRYEESSNIRGKKTQYQRVPITENSWEIPSVAFESSLYLKKNKKKLIVLIVLSY